jgi:hypothetical protein
MPDEKPLKVTDRRRGAYRRVIRTRPMTFVCAECGREVTEEIYPGPMPKYRDGCIRNVRKRQTVERVRRHRANKKG